ncbi:MAG: MFS transporter [Chloroflexota bacterium]|nr:MFS transporter [Chloroflexota bacterium]
MAVETTTYEPRAKRRWRISRVYYGWYVLFGMVVALIVAEGVTIGSLSAYTQPLENHFGWTRAQVSMGFSVTVGTIGLFAPIIGRLIDVVGPRRLMLIGAPLCGAAFVLLAFMTELWQWYVYLGISSLALGLIAYIPAQALAVRWFDQRRAVALSIIGASVWMGQLLMLPLVQVIISSLGWEDAFIYSGMLVVGAYIVAFIFVRDQPRANESDSGTASAAVGSSQGPVVLSGMTLGQTMRTPLFWALVFGLMLLYFVVFGWMSQGVPYYQSVGFSDTWSAQIVSLTAGGAVVWLLVAGSQLERFRRPERIAAVGALFVCGSLMVLYVTGGDIPGVSVAVVLYIVGFAATPPLEALMLSRAFGLKNFATIMGSAFLFQTIAIVFSPIIAGSIYDRDGNYDLVLIIYAVCVAASCLVFLVASRLPQPFAHQARLDA